MASVNKVIIIGNLGRDPETRAFPSGDQICNIRVATTDKWKDKQTGESRDHTEWHSIVFNGRLAEIASQYLRKGSQVYVEGSLRTRKWQDQNGNDRYSTEIRADSMKMLGSRQGMGGDDSYGNSGYGGGGNSAAFKPSANRGEPPASGGFAAAPNQGGGFEGGNGGAGFVAPTPAAPPRQQAPAYAPAPAARPGSGFGEMDDDIPF